MKKEQSIIIFTILMFTFASAVFANVIIKFDPPSLYNGGKQIDEYYEQNFHFITPNGMSHMHYLFPDGLSPCNGTAYLRFTKGPYAAPLTIHEINGTRFDLTSVDLAYYSNNFSISDIPVAGYRDGIECCRDILHPTSINFKTFELSNNFKNLDYVEFLTVGYSIDNVNLKVVPEPATLSLLILGGLVLLRKRN